VRITYHILQLNVLFTTKVATLTSHLKDAFLGDKCKLKDSMAIGASALQNAAKWTFSLIKAGIPSECVRITYFGLI